MHVGFKQQIFQVYKTNVMGKVARQGWQYKKYTTYEATVGITIIIKDTIHTCMLHPYCFSSNG